MSMFCYQCEQTAKGRGCNYLGYCGKDPETAALQDLLLYAAKGVASYADRARKLGAMRKETDAFMLDALFTTVTNVNFDPERLEILLRRAAEELRANKELYEQASRKQDLQPEKIFGPAAWQPAATRGELLVQAREIGIEQRIQEYGPDLSGLQELLTYGLKGMAAYAKHAAILGHEEKEACDFFYEALRYLGEEEPEADKLLALCLHCGEVNLKVMALLDKANTGAYGDPVPTKVRITPVKGKAILVSGHDLADLEALLAQTEGTGIKVYTHGEMLPAHGYPGLKKHKHLVGNYGGAWQNQLKEFAEFPGAILMTTNCIQNPQESYMGRIFTSGLVAWPGVVHVSKKDFSPVINAALSAPGFEEDGEEQMITVGFGHQAVLSVADKVVEAVKAGAIKHFFLIGGCDGAKPGRNYYTEFARAVPKDSVILTLACGKYRFNKEEFGEIGGIPRLLDIGQCNDAYSAIQIAVALAGAFECGVNDLPLSLIISWYEQKAVAILLTLLYLGIKNIRLGPTLPAFITPSVLNLLVEKYQIKPITTVDADLAACLGA